ncbi:hypothetical protein ACKFKF_03565 [Phormidesmis sp. 146-12]
MRFVNGRSQIVLLAALMAFPLHPAIGAPQNVKETVRRVELPKIQTNCKTEFQPREPILLYGFGNGSSSDNGGRIDFKQEQQIKERIWKLIYSKQWDEALVEIQKQPRRIQLEMFPQLLSGLVWADEGDRASRLVIAQFPRQTYERAQGVGTIAKALIRRDQLPKAIAVLKTVPQDSKYLDETTTPVAIALVKTNQLEKLREVTALFPSRDAQAKIWLAIADRISFEPLLSKQIAAMIEDRKLRSQTLRKIAMKWLYASGQEALKGWVVANEIEDCVIRSKFFLEIADRITDSPSKDHSREKSETLTQIEALLNGIDESKLGDRRALAQLRLSLAQFNFRAGRTTQATKLLQQVTEDQKRFQFYADRAEILLEIAQQYEKFQKVPSAVQTLDLAVVAVQTAFSKKENSVEGLPSSSTLPIVEWRDRTLSEIAMRYRSLKQPQKAAAIDRMFPKARFPLPMMQLPQIFTVPAAKPPSSR